MHPVALIAEIGHVGPRPHVCFGQNDRVALPPLQKFPEQPQHFIMLGDLLLADSLTGDHEGNRIHTKA